MFWSSSCLNGSPARKVNKRAAACRKRSITTDSIACSPISLKSAIRFANRAALAEECLELGKFEEARRHYEHILPMGDDSVYALGEARGQFGLGHAPEAVATLDDLRARWPTYQWAEGHLLYPRALVESGRMQDALLEYQAVANYHPEVEARVRCGLLLDKAGRRFEANAVLGKVLARFKPAPRHVRQAQSEWIARAEKTLREGADV